MTEKYYYSQSTGGFYCDSIHGSNKPNDCIEIIKKRHQELLNKAPGMEIIVEEGIPVLKEHEYTKKELLNTAKNIVFSKCDNLKLKLIKNETYQYKEDYQETKEVLLAEIQNYRDNVIPSLETKTVEELKDFINF